MTKKELEKKVIELEAQVAVLKELLTLRLPANTSIPSVWQTPDCQHDWNYGTAGAYCRKCGKQNALPYIVTCNSVMSSAITNDSLLDTMANTVSEMNTSETKR